MAAAPTIWVSGDMSEQISDFNGQYVLITTQDMKKVMLGKTLEAMREKLIEIGRYDIAAQLK